jgi:hypothetical protein
VSGAIFASCGGGSSQPLPQGPDEADLITKIDLPKGLASYNDPLVDWTWDLIAGQNQLVGTVHLYNDAHTFFVAFNLIPGQTMTEAQVYIGLAEPDPNGNPGGFPYKQTFDPAVSSYTFEIPLENLTAKSQVHVAVHAAMSSTETAWAGRWNNGTPKYQFGWDSKWGGYFHTRIKPVFDPVLDWKTYKGFHYGAVSYWGINFNDETWYPFPGSNTWVGWCVDPSRSMYRNFDYRVQVYSCYDPNLPVFAQSPNWDLISYLINKRNIGLAMYNQDWTNNGDNLRFTVDCPKDHFQKAIWYFMGGGPAPLAGTLGDKFVKDAQKYGEDFIPGPGQHYAVILYPDLSGSSSRAQMNIIEVDP